MFLCHLDELFISLVSRNVCPVIPWSTLSSRSGRRVICKSFSFVLVICFFECSANVFGAQPLGLGSEVPSQNSKDRHSSEDDTGKVEGLGSYWEEEW
jgi:hypothetical protein